MKRLHLAGDNDVKDWHPMKIVYVPMAVVPHRQDEIYADIAYETEEDAYTHLWFNSKNYMDVRVATMSVIDFLHWMYDAAKSEFLAEWAKEYL